MNGTSIQKEFRLTAVGIGCYVSAGIMVLSRYFPSLPMLTGTTTTTTIGHTGYRYRSLSLRWRRLRSGSWRPLSKLKLSNWVSMIGCKTYPNFFRDGVFVKDCLLVLPFTQLPNIRFLAYRYCTGIHHHLSTEFSLPLAQTIRAAGMWRISSQFLFIAPSQDGAPASSALFFPF